MAAPAAGHYLAGELLQSFQFGQFCLFNSLRERTEIPVVRR